MTLGTRSVGSDPSCDGRAEIAADGLHRRLVARLQKLERGAPLHLRGGLRA